MSKKIIAVMAVVLLLVAIFFLRNKNSAPKVESEDVVKKIEVKKLPYNGSGKACDILSPEVAQAFLKTVIKDNDSSDNRCSYGDSEPVYKSENMLLLVKDKVRAEDYARYEERKYQKFTDLGDVAYWNAAGNMLSIKVGEVNYLISARLNNQVNADNAKIVAESIKERLK